MPSSNKDKRHFRGLELICNFLSHSIFTSNEAHLLDQIRINILYFPLCNRLACTQSRTLIVHQCHSAIGYSSVDNVTNEKRIKNISITNPIRFLDKLVPISRNSSHGSRRTTVQRVLPLITGGSKLFPSRASIFTCTRLRARRSLGR